MRAVYGMILLAASVWTVPASADHWSDFRSSAHDYVYGAEHFRVELEERRATSYVIQTAYRLERAAREMYNLSRGRSDLNQILFTHREVLDGQRRLTEVVSQMCHTDRHLMRDFESLDRQFSDLNEAIACMQREATAYRPSPSYYPRPNVPTHPYGVSPYGNSNPYQQPYGNSFQPGYGRPFGSPTVNPYSAQRPATPHDLFRSMHEDMMRSMFERSRR